MKRSINLLLIDGNATGCWKGEFSNRTLVAYRMSRQQLVGGYESRPEFGSSGVYILFGQNDDGDPLAYIGEAEDGMKRVRQHLNDGKDFWTEFILFVKSDNKLNKAHVRYLEDRLIKQAQSAGRYELDNGMSSPSASLSENDEADMQELLDDIQLMTGVLGQKIFEPVAQRNIQDKTSPSYSLKVGKANAQGDVTSDGFVVYAGATFGPEVSPSLGNGYLALREKLFDDQVVDANYILQKDQLFGSSSAAAAVILGYNVSGPQKWVDGHGISLRDNETRASVQG